jgi:hypothetical protein
MSFSNQSAFDNPRSRMAAAGADLRASNAITDPRGRVLAYAQTGGMLSPTRFEIAPGVKLFRFGNSAAGTARVAGGSWWVEQAALEKLVRFAQVWDLSVGAAMRFLCLVPPEWSEASLLVRARAVKPLLAWRGLANTVVTPATGGGPAVRMPHQNDIAERRLFQLFVPGLSDDPGVQAALAIEQEYRLDAAASKQGFLYL